MLCCFHVFLIEFARVVVAAITQFVVVVVSICASITCFGHVSRLASFKFVSPKDGLKRGQQRRQKQVGETGAIAAFSSAN